MTSTDNWHNTDQTHADIEQFKACKHSSSVPETVSAIAKQWWNKPAKLFRMLGNADALLQDAVEVRTVGVYYFRMGIGGAERVVSKLIPLWQSMGFRVVLFTDEPEQPGDYTFNSDVQRVVLPPFHQVTEENYVHRARALHEALLEYNVDALVYGQWISHVLPWDMLVCKAHNIPFIAYTHGSFRSLLCEADALDYQQAVVYGYADGILVLSETDERFWRLFNPRVWKTINPLTLKPCADTRSSLTGKTIIWLGRLDPFDKQPGEALEIMRLVKDTVPDAQLLMVGPAPDGATIQGLQQRTKDWGLTDCVTFTGAQDNPEPFLQQSRAYLLTSRFEGYCLALAEAKAKGLPSVSYELPYLTLTRGNCGVQMVPHYNHRAAADALVQLLNDDVLCKEQADAAFEQMDTLAKFDFTELWSNIFASLSAGSASRAHMKDDDLLWDTLMDACLASFSKLQHNTTYAYEQRDSAIRQLNEAVSQRLEVEQSTTYKVGRVLTAAPRKIKDTHNRSKHSDSAGEATPPNTTSTNTPHASKQTSKPLVSVIVPVYNKAAFIEGALESLLGQTYYNLQIICVDNNSTDGSRDIIETFARKDERIVVLEEHEQQGAGAARNVGLNAAQGDYIGFFDADDFIDPTMYEQLVDAIEQQNASMAVGGLDHYFAHQDAYLCPLVPGMDKTVSSVELGGRIFFVTNPSVCTKLFNRQFLQDHALRFRTDVRTAEDLTFTYTALMMAGTIAFRNTPLYHYRQRVEGSLTHRNSKLGTQVFDCFRTLEHTIDGLENQSDYRIGLLNYVLEQTRYIMGVACDLDEYTAQFDEFKTNWHPRIRKIKDFLYDEVRGIYERYDKADTVEQLMFAELSEKLIWLNDKDGEISSMRNRLNDAENRLREVELSSTYKVGRGVMALPCTLKDALT